MSSFARFDAMCKPSPGRTLIVGSKVYKTRTDRRLRYPPGSVVGADMLPGDGVDVVLDLEEPLPEGFGPFNHIECMSVLEHSKRPWLLAANLEELLAPRGTLFLCVPFVWRVHAYPDDYWRMTAAGVRLLFPRMRWEHLYYAHRELREDHAVPALKHQEATFLERTEIYGFGVHT